MSPDDLSRDPETGEWISREEWHARVAARVVGGRVETKLRATSNPISLERKDAEAQVKAIRDAATAAATCGSEDCLEGQKVFGSWHARQHAKARDDDEERDDLGRFVPVKTRETKVERGRFERPSPTRQDVERALAEMAAYAAKYTT